VKYCITHYKTLISSQWLTDQSSEWAVWHAQFMSNSSECINGNETLCNQNQQFFIWEAQVYEKWVYLFLQWHHTLNQINTPFSWIFCTMSAANLKFDSHLLYSTIVTRLITRHHMHTVFKVQICSVTSLTNVCITNTVYNYIKYFLIMVNHSHAVAETWMNSRPGLFPPFPNLQSSAAPIFICISSDF